ncbi:type IV toxin-antitoxin system AbiEi family antitoxin domain-containing protein [Tomitella gaofuii]|uniref:type IV toxin-antitoxin system AbiEi family antitoxin domain-containing protein n=1 Tax=Tomitella gaofuii TaxID=2760083 RepID=UPI0015F9EBBF|nr:type IV toxin-antitoxin system AbiEi family antitoxin domain-containing protein [Tomitella gaofuii]
MGSTQLSFRTDALRRGVDDHGLHRMRQAGDLVTVRPGVYAAPSACRTRRSRHRAAIVAALAKLHSPAVISHISAAALHGLPLLDADLSRVHMTRTGSGGGTTSPRRRLHVTPLTPEDITEVDGIPVTTIARTITDLALESGFDKAVAIGDNALNNALVATADLHAAMGRTGRRIGAHKARSAIRFMDCRSESPGESLSRVALDRLGIRGPELQRVIRSHGQHLARVDFYLDDEGIVGEFDGVSKYSGSEETPAPESPAAVLVQEKKREDRLRRCGLVVARWGWKDLHTPGELERIITAARELAADCPAPRIDAPDPRDVYVPRRRPPSE